MRTLKPAVQYCLKADGGEEPITPTPDRTQILSSPEFTSKVAGGGGGFVPFTSTPVQAGSFVAMTPVCFSPLAAPVATHAPVLRDRLADSESSGGASDSGAIRSPLSPNSSPPFNASVETQPSSPCLSSGSSSFSASSSPYRIQHNFGPKQPPLHRQSYRPQQQQPLRPAQLMISMDQHRMSPHRHLLQHHQAERQRPHYQHLQYPEPLLNRPSFFQSSRETRQRQSYQRYESQQPYDPHEKRYLPSESDQQCQSQPCQQLHDQQPHEAEQLHRHESQLQQRQNELLGWCCSPSKHENRNLLLLPQQQHQQQQHPHQLERGRSTPSATPGSPPCLLPGELLQRRGGVEDRFLAPANAVEASYWRELQRLFPSMPSSGRRSIVGSKVGGVASGEQQQRRQQTSLQSSSGQSNDHFYFRNFPPLVARPPDDEAASVVSTPSPPPTLASFPSTTTPEDVAVDEKEENDRGSTASGGRPSSFSIAVKEESYVSGSDERCSSSASSSSYSSHSSSAEATLITGLERFMRPLAMQMATKLHAANLDSISKSFKSNGKTVLFDEIDAKLMQNRRSRLGLPADDFFARSVAVTDMIRPSQRLGINSKEAWSRFRRQSESSSLDVNNNDVDSNDDKAAGVGFADDGFGESRTTSSVWQIRPARLRNPNPRVGKSASQTSVGSRGSSSSSTSTLVQRRDVFSSATDGNVEKKCNFCYNNKEPIEVWSSHDLKDDKGKIACAILRKYVCPRCGATGDKAHTNRYCPKNKSEDGKCVTSIKDLNTGRTSAGRFSMNANAHKC